jgi:hypothetical protein
VGKLVATSGEKRWPPVGKFVAAVGENLMAIDRKQPLDWRECFAGVVRALVAFGEIGAGGRESQRAFVDRPTRCRG